MNTTGICYGEKPPEISTICEECSCSEDTGYHPCAVVDNCDSNHDKPAAKGEAYITVDDLHISYNIEWSDAEGIAKKTSIIEHA